MPPATFRYVHVDVFTETPLTGNPLAVFTDARGMPESIMQAVAREIGFSETTFVLPATEPGADARIRIFTPRVELPFAGHPVLGSAFVLAAPLQRDSVRLQTGRGVVPVRFDGPNGYAGFGRMSQPLPQPIPAPDLQGLGRALGFSALPNPSGAFPRPPVAFDNGPTHVIAVVEDVDRLRALRPDFPALAALWPGTIVVAAPIGSAHVEARVFVPGGGVDEDPATGSAAGPLAVHLCQLGLCAWGAPIQIDQGITMGRPARLVATAHGSSEAVTAVEVGGGCVLIARGDMRLVV